VTGSLQIFDEKVISTLQRKKMPTGQQVRMLTQHTERNQKIKKGERPKKEKKQKKKGGPMSLRKEEEDCLEQSRGENS